MLDNIKIHLNTFDKIKKYISIVEGLDYDIDLISERYVVDGKSILGILSLDLSKPVEVSIVNKSSDKEGIEGSLKELEEFMV